MRYWMQCLNKPCKQARMPLRTVLTVQWNTPPERRKPLLLGYHTASGRNVKKNPAGVKECKIKNEK
jgi:hypothetical protein